MDADIWYVLRMFNGITGIIVAVILAHVIHRRVKRKEIESADLLMRQGIVVYLLAASYSTLALLRAGAPGGWWLGALAVALTWMLVGVIQIELRERKL